MSDARYLASVAKMTALKLLAEVINHPEYLTDPYYRTLGNAIRARYMVLMLEKVKEKRPKQAVV